MRILLMVACLGLYAQAPSPIPVGAAKTSGPPPQAMPERFPIPDEDMTLFKGLLAQATAIQKAEDVIRRHVCESKAISFADCDVSWVQGAQPGTFGKRFVPAPVQQQIPPAPTPATKPAPDPKK